MRHFFSIILVLTIAACKGPQMPKTVLPPEKMQAVMWDYFKADIYVNEYMRADTTVHNLDVESARLQQKIFNKHKVSSKQFYTSLDYYLAHTDLLKNLMDTMIVRQEKPLGPGASTPEKSETDTVKSKIKNLLDKKRIPKLYDTLKHLE